MLFFAGLAQAAGTILVWGDSLSAGYGLEKGQDWPTLLQTRLQAEGFRHVVVNSSVSGETSSGGRTRLPDALAEHSPTLVILELGANDGLRGLKPQLLADNLGAMIDAARDAIQMPSSIISTFVPCSSRKPRRNSNVPAGRSTNIRVGALQDWPEL